MTAEEDTYSTIFTALKHPIRRNILRQLSTTPVSYTELLNSLGVENGLLNYHLDSMRELIRKNEDGTYSLSEFGKAGLNLIQRVEEPITKSTDIHLQRQSLLIKVLSIAIIVILSFSTWSLYSSNQVLKMELGDQKNKVAVLQSTIQKLTTRNISYKIIFSKASYRVGDTINATLSIINPTNQTIIVVPPTKIVYSGSYEGESVIIERTVLLSYAFSNFTGVEVLPEHAFDVWTMTFTAYKAGTFEVRCNELIGTVPVYPLIY